jgi:hypothetical protein
VVFAKWKAKYAGIKKKHDEMTRQKLVWMEMESRSFRSSLTAMNDISSGEGSVSSSGEAAHENAQRHRQIFFCHGRLWSWLNTQSDN